MSEDPLQTPVQFVTGAGPARAALLSKLGLYTVEDLLWYLPRDVLDLSEVTPVPSLKADELQTVRGVVVDRDARQLAHGRMLSAVLLDCNGHSLRGVWFNQPWVLQKFFDGQAVLFSGKPKRRGGRWEMSHPRIQWIEEDDANVHGGVLPKYGLTEGLRMHEMRRICRAAAEQFAEFVFERLPDELRERNKLAPIRQAIMQLHLPADMQQYEAARRRLIFEDLLEFQLALALRRRAWKKNSPAPRLPTTAKIDARIRRLFPFDLTAGQDQAVREIAADLNSGRAMHRLLQADVGAGKTAVALYAMLVAVAAGYQTVLMAPTELLALQHWQTVEEALAHSRVKRALLTGSLTAAQRLQTVDEIRKGDVQLVVGTQAVIQQDVRFARLGLVVIDEQHKFGVEQRARFSAGDESPHVLVMTATPIPRSLCLTQFGDLDLSLMTDLPPGRQRVVTSRVYSGPSRRKAWEFIRKSLEQGRQAYVVCPRVNEGESGGESEEPGIETPVRDAESHGPPSGRCPPPVGFASHDAQLSTLNSQPSTAHQGADAPRSPLTLNPQSEIGVPATAGHPQSSASAEQVYRQLSADELKHYSVGLVHGQMPRKQRAEVMESFRAGQTQVLVATTVVEVGVDVPNATLMIVQQAERFGLSQLHQLRGRIARGTFQGYCFLFSDATSDEAIKRLSALEATSDGFQIAEVDFEIRGPGDVLGTRQHGELPLKVANLARDQDILLEAREAAFALVDSTQIDTPQHRPLKVAVLERFGQLMNLSQTG